MANEADFLELLVANERVGRWMDILMDPFQRTRHKYAIAQLQQDLQRGSSYVEEAARMGITQVLTKLLSQASPEADDLRADEKTMEAISRIIAACSGPMACGGKVASFSYGDIKVCIREGALGDGLGAKVWSVCHIMCRELVAHPELFRGQRVLELGSGTGLVGIVAALAGAQQVVLTDYEDQVLANLRVCMHMNTLAVKQQAAAAISQQQQQQQHGSRAHSPTAAVAAAADGAQSHALDDLFAAAAGDTAADGSGTEGEGCIPNDDDLFNDAESVDELDFAAMLGSDSSGAAAGTEKSTSGTQKDADTVTADIAAKLTGWDADNMAVRLLDWQESADALAAAEAGTAAVTAAAVTAAAVTAAESQQQSSSSGKIDQAPGVPVGQQFSVILANEVMYELAHAQLVAAAIKHRLARGGRALLCCAVRDQKVFDMFRDSCRRWGLRYRVVRVQPEIQDLGGIRGRERDYEGGFLLMAVDHADSTATDWHRDDFEIVD